MSSLNSWIQTHWVPVIDYALIVHFLTRGWVGFIFHTKDDAWKILGGHWYWDKHVLSAKPYHPLFDAWVELVTNDPIWIKLSKLPLEL